MRAAFDQELTELRARLVELGEMVQTQLDHALAALVTGDTGAIQGIVGGDQQIDQLSAEIDWGLVAHPGLPGPGRLGSAAGRRAAACQRASGADG